MNISSNSIIRELFRDLYNSIRYPSLKINKNGTIIVDPSLCNTYIHSKTCVKIDQNISSAIVTNLNFLNCSRDIFELEKLNYCYSHWVDGKSWEESGAIDLFLKRLANNQLDHGINNIYDFSKRLERLDYIFYKSQQNGELYFDKSHSLPFNNKSRDGILIHVGPGCTPVFGLKGHHRFAISKILSFPFHAKIGLIHRDSISSVHRGILK